MDLILFNFLNFLSVLGFTLWALGVKQIPAKNRRDFIAYDD